MITSILSAAGVVVGFAVVYQIRGRQIHRRWMREMHLRYGHLGVEPPTYRELMRRKP